MLKKIFITLAATLLGLYVVVALFFLNSKKDETLCKGTDIVIYGDGSNVLSIDNVNNILKNKHLHPAGKKMEDIDCGMIEKAINSYSLVDECQSYKTHKQLVGIRIKCKKPIMHIFDKNEKEFFIDEKGDIIEGMNSTLYLPIANGFIERDMAKKELLDIAIFLQNNKFWQEQIEQIYFTPSKDIVIIPRVGNHTIEIGKSDNLEQKFDKLLEFYEKGLNEIGWNKYKKINIEFDNKVIGTKR